MRDPNLSRRDFVAAVIVLPVISSLRTAAVEDVLIVEAILQSGQTSEFLIRNMMGRGAASVKLIALLDKQKARRVALQPDYFGFVLDESFVVGYGLGAPDVGRNLPYIAAVPGIGGPEA